MNLKSLKELLGFEFESFDVIDSTSLYLARLIKEGKAPPRLVIASEQTNGQGRLGKSFYSPKNSGLYLTFCFPQEQILSEDLTPRLALAVCDAIFQTFSISCQIKWVNDLYLFDRKVSGVLCQKVGSFYLFGIGINLCLPSVIPSELKDRLGALFESYDSKNNPIFIFNLYRSLCENLEKNKNEVLKGYRARLVHLNRPVTIIQNNVPVSGICIGISDDFALLVQTENGTQSFTSGFMMIK